MNRFSQKGRTAGRSMVVGSSAALLASVVCSAAAGAAPARTGATGSSGVARTLWGAQQRPAAKTTAAAASIIVQHEGAWTPERENEVRRLGGYVYRNLPLISAVAVRVPAKNQNALVRWAWVRHVSPDAAVRKNDEFIVDSSLAGTVYAQQNLTGVGVGVAVVDSGVRGLQDLNDAVNTSAARIVARVNYASGTTVPDDQCGHGTHVAGIIAGNGAGSTGSTYYRTFYGIARRANIISVKVLNDQGGGSVSDVVKGIAWTIANKSKYNIRVMNLSLGHPAGESYTTDPLCQAVEAAYKSGITVVCAAGNDGRASDKQTTGAANEGWGTAYGSVQSPANDPYVITVGAMKSMGTKGRGYDQIATYSGRGPTRLDLVCKPDIVAPGNRVISLAANNTTLYNAYSGTNQIPLQDYVNTLSTNTSARYFRLSGTSMAAPVVAGAVALMLEKYPTLTPDTIKARLMMSADKWTQPDGSADPCTFGAGYLNISQALASTVTATQPALSPKMYTDASGNVYIDGNSISGQRALWGSDVTDLRAIWGSRALWGSNYNTLTGSRALWGSSVWADRALWGSSAGNADLSSRAISGE